MNNSLPLGSIPPDSDEGALSEAQQSTALAQVEAVDSKHSIATEDTLTAEAAVAEQKGWEIPKRGFPSAKQSSEETKPEEDSTSKEASSASPTLEEWQRQDANAPFVNPYGSQRSHDQRISGGQVGVAVSGDVYGNVNFVGEQEEASSTPIPSEKLEKAQTTFVKAQDLDIHKLQEFLKQKHMVLLAAPYSTGRYITALYCVSVLSHQHLELLDLNIPSFKVLKKWKPASQTAYIAELPKSISDHKDFPAMLSMLSRTLQTVQSYLIFIAYHHLKNIPPLQYWTISWHDYPHGETLLRKLLHWHARNMHNGQSAWAILMQDEQPWVELVSGTRPAEEIEQIALALLKASLEGEANIASVISQFSRDRDLEVSMWLEGKNISDDDRVRIWILAILGGSPVTIINTAAIDLLRRIRSPRGIRLRMNPPQTELFNRPRSKWVQECRATPSSAVEPLLFGTGLVERIDLADQSLKRSVLKYMWAEFPELHHHLCMWLRDLAHNDQLLNNDAMVAARIGSAVAFLATLNKIIILKDILESWVVSENGNDTEALINVLRTLITYDNSEEFVYDLLYEWSKSANAKLQQVVIIALRGPPGWKNINKALTIFYTIYQQLSVTTDLLRTACMLLWYEPIPTLQALTYWSKREQKSDILAADQATPQHSGKVLLLFVKAALMLQTGAENDSIPYCLWAHSDPAFRELHVMLWRQALNHSASRAEALNTLSAWIKQADKNEVVRMPLRDFFLNTIEQGNSRAIGRIDYFLSTLSRKVPHPSKMALFILQELHLERSQA